MKLAIEGGCNAVASTLGVLGSVARKYAHKIPFILKYNHNEFLSYPIAVVTKYNLVQLSKLMKWVAWQLEQPFTLALKKADK